MLGGSLYYIKGQQILLLSCIAQSSCFGCGCWVAAAVSPQHQDTQGSAMPPLCSCLVSVIQQLARTSCAQLACSGTVVCCWLLRRYGAWHIRAGRRPTGARPAVMQRSAVCTLDQQPCGCAGCVVLILLFNPRA